MCNSIGALFEGYSQNLEVKDYEEVIYFICLLNLVE